MISKLFFILGRFFDQSDDNQFLKEFYQKIAPTSIIDCFEVL
jgi:hypothetical protein